MRVHVISDMEGVAGIVKWQQTTGGEKLYDEGRALYTEEINAAVRGAKAAGATEIVVMDCHGAGGAYDFNSLLPELLDPACQYVVHKKCPVRSTSIAESSTSRPGREPGASRRDPTSAPRGQQPGAPSY